MHVSQNNWRAGFLLALGAALMWGVLPIALKGLLPDLDAVTITWYRFAGAALLLGLYLGPRGRLPRPSQFLGWDGVLMLVAALALNVNYVVYVFGLEHVTPATAQIVIQFAPLTLLLGALVVYGERLSRQQVAGIFTFLVGLGCFFNQRLPELFTSLTDYTAGVAWIMLAAFLWGVYALCQKQLLNRFESSATMWVVYLSGALVFLPAAQPARALELDGVGLAVLAFASLNTLIAYACFAESLEQWEASRSSAVLSMIPISTAFFAEVVAVLAPGWVPPESWSPLSLLGAALVVVGSAAAALGKRED